MKPTSSPPRARLVLKTPSVPVAQEPPVPVIQPSPPSAKAKEPASPEKVKKQHRQQLMSQAEELSRQNGGLHPQCAYEILLGKYTLEEWKARRRAAETRKQAAFQARAEESRSEEEKAWCSPFLKASEREPVWLETTCGDQIALITRWKPFQGKLEFPDRSWRIADKRELSALCSARLSPQVLGMRQVGPESQRSMLPAVKPAERWPFPEESFATWIGQLVQVQLLNGSTWTGYLRWNSRYTFLLGAQPTDAPEVLLFKHACCCVQLLH